MEKQPTFRTVAQAVAMLTGFLFWGMLIRAAEGHDFLAPLAAIGGCAAFALTVYASAGRRD